MLKLKIFLLFVFCNLCLVDTAQAGSPGPLCDAVNASPYIVEITLDTTVAQYSKAAEQKKWAPEASAIEAIAKTAKIIAVHKGDKKVGDLLNESDLISAAWGQHAHAFWQTFFSQKQMVMLTGPGLNGWISDGGDEGIPNESLAFQKNYETLKKAVLQCLLQP